MRHHVFLHNRKRIEEFLQRDASLHIYGLGDLDDFFWPYTTWFGLTENDTVLELALLYSGLSLPTLLAFSTSGSTMQELLEYIIHLLPCRFYAHISSGLESTFATDYTLVPHGEHDRMTLIDRGALQSIGCPDAVILRAADLDNILELFRESYPGNWFDKRMLDTGKYFGIRENGLLVSIAGVHVYSPKFGVAALGNITTRPAFRGKGYGKRVTAALCRSLLQNVDHIGLNVKTDNSHAINCYKNLGFEITASFGEYLLERKRHTEG